MITRSLFAAALLAASALAAPPLTTIQDVLYKADGTRFNGTLTISWTSFEALDSSAIATQSTTVKVVDGILRVQLVPTTSATPAVYYSVKYNSDGRVQFQETWSVPSSAQTLRVRDVRIASPGGVSEVTEPGNAGVIEESDVQGLIADLGARPLKGPGYAAGRVAMVGAMGALESVAGSPTDCVRVDGSSGPCGATPPEFVDADAPAGLVDGANLAFSLTATPDPVSSLAIYRNGMLQKSGSDYTADGRNILFVAASTPQPGDTLLASYRLTGGGTESSAQLYPSPQVVCSGTGGATNAAEYAGVGVCTIPAGLLRAGDRVSIRFDLEHQGTASGWTFQTLWGGTSIMNRDLAANDALATGRAEAAIQTSGAQLSHQSWGGALPFAAGVAKAADAWADGLVITFRARLATAGDTVTLRGYSVVRLP